LVLQARWALEAVLGVSVDWNQDGPVCDLNVPRAVGAIRIQRHFSAEAGRLVVTTILVKPISPDERESVAAGSPR
jgi:hypothetical protein